MPARRVPKPPRNVSVASLADTGHPATDRVMIQVEQNLQDLQEGQRSLQATAALQDAILRFGTDSSLRHLSTLLGFFSAAATTQPTITGSRGGNAALASLLTAGATLGLWIDSTTA